MTRKIYEAQHEAFRETVRAFVARDIVPHLDDWATARRIDRSVHRAAAEAGVLGLGVPTEYGGNGIDDFRYNAVLIEELVSAGAAPLVINFSGFNDLVAPYFVKLGTDEQKRRWLTPVCAGEAITSIGMTEPGTGSDLKSISTTAVRDGDELVINGTKTFIGNGMQSDLVLTAVATGADLADDGNAREGLSLVVIERGTPGFTSEQLNKIGLQAQDTATLTFKDVRVPIANLLGEAGRGMAYMSGNLPQERLSIAVVHMTGMRGSFEKTVDYVNEREAFGRAIIENQYIKFSMAELATEIDVAQAYLDQCMAGLLDGTTDAVDAAKVKWWVTEAQQRILAKCLQFHGGNGYLADTPIVKDFLDSRPGPIYGGTTEIMKEIIGRTLVKKTR